MAATLDPYLNQLRRRYQAFSLRERVLVGLTLAAALWLLWSIAIQDPLTTAVVAETQSAQLVQQQLQAEQALNDALTRSMRQDPDAPLLAEQAQLDAELQRLTASLGAVLDRFVAPETIPALLKDVVNANDGVRVQRIVRLPVEPVTMHAGDAADTDQAAAQPAAAVYRHPFRVELEGDFFALLEYVQRLEGSRWTLNWRTLDYEVLEHPRARLALEVETLSRERSWIGV